MVHRIRRVLINRTLSIPGTSYLHTKSTGQVSSRGERSRNIPAARDPATVDSDGAWQGMDEAIADGRGRFLPDGRGPEVLAVRGPLGEVLTGPPRAAAAPRTAAAFPAVATVVAAARGAERCR